MNDGTSGNSSVESGTSAWLNVQGRPKLLDLYCSEGGAARGYQLAGWHVTGVDIDPQPRYAGDLFLQGDVLEVLGDKSFISQFHAVHASPPCQHFTSGAGQNGTRDNHPNLIGPTRQALRAIGATFVIENVPNARAHMINPITLCGQHFGLGVFRHRLFEVPWWKGVVPPHVPHEGKIGDGRFFTVTGHPGGYSLRDKIHIGSKDDWSKAMGIDWMTAHGLAEAIPPAMTEFIGAELLIHVTAEGMV